MQYSVFLVCEMKVIRTCLLSSASDGWQKDRISDDAQAQRHCTTNTVVQRPSVRGEYDQIRSDRAH